MTSESRLVFPSSRAAQSKFAATCPQFPAAHVFKYIFTMIKSAHDERAWQNVG